MKPGCSLPVAGPDRREPEGEGVESIKSRRGGERAAAGQMGTVITVYIPRRIYASQTSVMIMARMIGHGAKIEGVAVRLQPQVGIASSFRTSRRSVSGPAMTRSPRRSKEKNVFDTITYTA